MISNTCAIPILRYDRKCKCILNVSKNKFSIRFNSIVSINPCGRENGGDNLTTWWPDNTRSRAINSHSADLVLEPVGEEHPNVSTLGQNEWIMSNTEQLIYIGAIALAPVFQIAIKIQWWHISVLHRSLS